VDWCIALLIITSGLGLQGQSAQPPSSQTANRLVPATRAGSPAFAPDGDQSRWLAHELAESTAAWKIPYFHHPPFHAGPGHGASLKVLGHWVDLFEKSWRARRLHGPRAQFSGE